MTLPSVPSSRPMRPGRPRLDWFEAKDPRQHGNVYQLESARQAAASARELAHEARRETRMLSWQVLILWCAIVALAVKVIL